MNNKYLSLALFGACLILSGIVYQAFYRPKSVSRIKPTGRNVEIHMRVLQNQWKWQVDTMQISYVDRKESLQRLPSIPEQATIKVQPGDKVMLHIFNEDTYDHGFAVDVLGVNRRLFPKTTTTVEFTPSLSGTFNFYCSVPCGEGHYDQIGTLIVGDKHATSGIYPNKNFACRESKKLVNQKQTIVAAN